MYFILCDTFYPWRIADFFITNVFNFKAIHPALKVVAQVWVPSLIAEYLDNAANIFYSGGLASLQSQRFLLDLQF